MEMGGNQFLIVESHHRNIVWHMHSSFTKRIEQAHGSAVVMAEYRRGASLHDLRHNAIPAFLIHRARHHHVWVVLQSCCSQGLLVPFQPALRGWRLLGGIDESYTPMTCIRQHFRSCAASLNFIRHHCRETTQTVKTVHKDGIHPSQVLRRANLVVNPRRIHNSFYLPFQHESASSALNIGISMCIDNQQDLPVAPSFILSPLDDLPGKWRRGHPIANKPDQIGSSSGKASGHGILSVSQIRRNFADLPHGGLGNPDVLIVIDCPGRRGNRNTCGSSDILKCNHGSSL